VRRLHSTWQRKRSEPHRSNLTLSAAEQFLKKEKWNLQQVRDFIPLPMTGSAAMYMTGLDINSEQPILIIHNAGERLRQPRMLRPNAYDARPNERSLDTVN